MLGSVVYSCRVHTHISLEVLSLFRVIDSARVLASRNNIHASFLMNLIYESLAARRHHAALQIVVLVGRSLDIHHRVIGGA